MNQYEHLLNSLLILASMVEARDPYTGGHLWRVSQFSRILAEHGGLPPNQVARISLGGFLHDLGKISVPDAILNKPGKLTDEEYDIIKTHPDVGRRLLTNHVLAGLVESAIYGHHERPDGNGYPRQLPHDRISVDALIVGICDAFDAMTSTRPYRKGMTIPDALAIIRENLGTQFDSTWGKRFLDLDETGELEHIVGHSEPGIPLHDCPMCGAAVVIRKNQNVGDHVYCRACGGESALGSGNGQTILTPTGRRGTPEQLEPIVDVDIIEQVIKDAAPMIGQLSH